MPDGGIKLGFRAHYPQIETKLTVRGVDMADVERKLAPVTAEVRRRLGNFIVAEDDRTLEGVVLAALAERAGTLAVVETFTSGQIAGRIAHLPGAEAVFRQGFVARDPMLLATMLGIGAEIASDDLAAAAATAARAASGATHALAILVDIDEGADRIDLGGTIRIAVADAGGVALRQARILGGRDWVRLGAVEMGLDCLRRHLAALPVDERIDFEKA